jgi:hypothetical protein
VLAAVQQRARQGLLPGAACTPGLAAAKFDALSTTTGLEGPEAAAAPHETFQAPELLAPLIDWLWAHRASDSPWTRPMAASKVCILRWKHAVFQSLGGHLGRLDLRSPRCDGCEEQPLCLPQTGIVIRRPHGDPAPQKAGRPT